MKREAVRTPPTSTVLPLPVVPHVGESDTDALAEIPGRPAETAEEDKEEEEEVDEFGYSWSEFTWSFSEAAVAYSLENHNKIFTFRGIFLNALFQFTVSYEKLILCGFCSVTMTLSEI